MIFSNFFLLDIYVKVYTTYLVNSLLLPVVDYRWVSLAVTKDSILKKILFILFAKNLSEVLHQICYISHS